jgi:molecular chaperone DnaK (HSP70)
VATIDDGQTSVLFSVTEGESERPDDCDELGELSLPIPPNQGAGYGIAIRYEYDVSGTLKVVATDPKTRERREITIQSPLRMTDNQVHSASRELALAQVE